MNPIMIISTVIPNVVGFAMPFIVEFVNRDISNAKTKFVVSFVLCLVMAILLNISKLSVGSVDGLLASLTLIFTECQVVFKLYFSGSALKASLQRNAAITTS